MGAGRFVCVALPFGLTLASLICILIVMLAGVTDKNLDLFTVNTQNLSISTSSLTNLAGLAKRADHFSALTIAALTGSSPSPGNITAADLGLADSYRVSLWNDCATSGTNTTCSSPKFDWASSALNTSDTTSLASSTGVNVTLPTEITSSLRTFAIVSKWTQVVYIIAFVTCVLELIVGLFAICSRIGSCCTFLISGFSTVSIIAASIMATVMSSIVTAALEATAKAYGVHSTINTNFLATTWLAVAFSLAGGLFWLFSTCCCAADHHKSNRRSRGAEDSEKLIPTGHYQRVAGDHNVEYAGQQSGVYQPQGQKEYGIPVNVKPTRGNGAYEPYSHTAI